jgi:hypothetical protein
VKGCYPLKQGLPLLTNGVSDGWPVEAGRTVEGETQAPIVAERLTGGMMDHA